MSEHLFEGLEGADISQDDIARKPKPLAERIRPARLNEVLGQAHLAGKLPVATQADTASAPDALEVSDAPDIRLHSMILWGPPGSGKTTIAKALAKHTAAKFVEMSAVGTKVEAVRKVLDIARAAHNETLLFVDEIHRFNRAQQDAFLPYMEDGSVHLVGATTENPSFALNAALLSRSRIYTLNPLDDAAIRTIIASGIANMQAAGHNATVGEAAKTVLVQHAAGDARRALNALEFAIQQASAHQTVDKNDTVMISAAMMAETLGGTHHRFDRGDDIWYAQISAIHKSVRGSDPDAALYWYCRMVAGGCDPLYVARRLLAIASEDIGNADPRALPLALAAWQTFERLGSYEGERAIAHAIIYLAMAPKSNAVDKALNAARKAVAQHGDLPVPPHLRNATSRVAREAGIGKGYRYPHDEADAFAKGECYLPEAIKDMRFYEPTEYGLEGKIQEKLARLRAWNAESLDKRYGD